MRSWPKPNVTYPVSSTLLPLVTEALYFTCTISIPSGRGFAIDAAYSPCDRFDSTMRTKCGPSSPNWASFFGKSSSDTTSNATACGSVLLATSCCSPSSHAITISRKFVSFFPPSPVTWKLPSLAMLYFASTTMPSAPTCTRTEPGTWISLSACSAKTVMRPVLRSPEAILLRFSVSVSLTRPGCTAVIAAVAISSSPFSHSVRHVHDPSAGFSIQQVTSTLAPESARKLT